MTSHAQRQHALWSPSASKRSVACPGSVSFCENEPSESDEHGARGTVGHEIAEAALRSGSHIPPEFEGRKALSGGHEIEITAELIRDASVYVEHCLELRSRAVASAIETKVPLAPLGLEIESFGLVDFWALLDDGVLHVVDLKMGFMRVAAKANWQIRTYGLGLVMLLQAKGAKLSSIVLTIVQPADEFSPVKTETLSLVELGMWALELKGAVSQAAKAREEMAVLPFEEWAAKWLRNGGHCHYCPKAYCCPALVGTALRLSATYFDNLPPEEIVRLKERAEQIGFFKKAIDAKAFSVAQSGVKLPGWTLTDSLGDREWIDEGATVAAVTAAGVSEADCYNRKLKSPAQLEKLLPKGQKKSTMESLTTRKITGTKLVREGDGVKEKASVVDQYFRG